MVGVGLAASALAVAAVEVAEHTFPVCLNTVHRRSHRIQHPSAFVGGQHSAMTHRILAGPQAVPLFKSVHRS